MKRLLCFASALLTWLAMAPAAAQEPAGVLLEVDTVIEAPPARVFNAMVNQVGNWWDPSHTYSGQSSNLSMDARPGGCFCETLPDSGGVEHMRILYSAPGQMLRLSGGLGPLQGTAVSGTMTFALSEQNGSTTLKLSYALSGFMPGGLSVLAPAIESVLIQQMQRLKNFVETDRPER